VIDPTTLPPDIALLVEALDNAEVGVSVLDQDLTLVYCNRKCLELMDFPEAFAVRGTPFETFIRYNAQRGEYGPGDIEALVAERVARARLREPHRFERTRPDGSRIEVIGRPLPSGGTVTSYHLRPSSHRVLHQPGLTFEQLLSALDQIAAGLHIWDPEGRLVYANARIRIVNEAAGAPLRAGMSFEEHIRERIAAGGLPDAAGDPEGYVARRMELHRLGDRHHTTRMLDGRWMMIRDYRLPDGSTVTTSQDITEMKRVEQAYRDSEQRFRDFVNASSDRFWETDADFRFTMLVDTNNERRFPPASQVIGKTRWEYVGIDPEDDENFAAHLAVLEAQQPFRDFRYVLPAPDGSPRYWRVSGVPIVNAEGRFAGYRGTSTDETEFSAELARAHNELQDALRTAEIANRSKSLFLATVSHELRTPLNAIIGFSELLVNRIFGPLGDPHYEDYARDIQTSGQHLLSLIEDVLDLSRVEMGQIRPRLGRVDLRREARSAIAMVQARRNQEIAEITLEIPAGFPDLNADARLIRQILINLISNAVKFTPPTGRITVSASIDDDGVLLVVADDGIGIDPKDHAKVLRPFEQADNRLSRRYDGVGLGLPLTKAFVESHGGTLELESAIGVGTTISIRLPPDRIETSDSATPLAAAEG